MLETGCSYKRAKDFVVRNSEPKTAKLCAALRIMRFKPTRVDGSKS
jgi:hypothetical protein